jgi:hypothetical protein
MGAAREFDAVGGAVAVGIGQPGVGADDVFRKVGEAILIAVVRAGSGAGKPEAARDLGGFAGGGGTEPRHGQRRCLVDGG